MGRAMAGGSAFDLSDTAGENDEGGWHAATVVSEKRAFSLISRDMSPDIGFDQSVNPYRG